VEIDTYLMEHPNGRELVNDLSAFVFPISGTQKGSGSKAESKKPAKPEGSKGASKDSVAVNAFLSAVGWTAERFQTEYTTIHQMMDKAPNFLREDRLSAHRGSRLITMSVIPWNLDAKNKIRDWRLVASAVTIESALIERYRGRLLELCPGARSLREELSKLFCDLTAPHNFEKGGQMYVVQQWEFADNISSEMSDTGGKLWNLKDLTDRWQAAHTAQVLKDMKDPILPLIQGLLKSPFLACSDVEAPAGTIETLAYHLITGLTEVSIVFHGCLRARFSHMQIMYKNKARIQHSLHDKMCDEQFNMDNVVVPLAVVSKKPHALSEEYRAQVNASFYFSPFLLSLTLEQLGYNHWVFQESATASLPVPATSHSSSPPLGAHNPPLQTLSTKSDNSSAPPQGQGPAMNSQVQSSPSPLPGAPLTQSPLQSPHPPIPMEVCGDEEGSDIQLSPHPSPRSECEFPSSIPHIIFISERCFSADEF
jgi:hypothetical protein